MSPEEIKEKKEILYVWVTVVVLLEVALLCAAEFAALSSVKIAAILLNIAGPIAPLALVGLVIGLEAAKAEKVGSTDVNNPAFTTGLQQASLKGAVILASTLVVLIFIPMPPLYLGLMLAGTALAAGTVVYTDILAYHSAAQLKCDTSGQAGGTNGEPGVSADPAAAGTDKTPTHQGATAAATTAPTAK